jgi:hypothetical protein
MKKIKPTRKKIPFLKLTRAPHQVLGSEACLLKAHEHIQTLQILHINPTELLVLLIFMRCIQVVVLPRRDDSALSVTVQ